MDSAKGIEKKENMSQVLFDIFSLNKEQERILTQFRNNERKQGFEALSTSDIQTLLLYAARYETQDTVCALISRMHPQDVQKALELGAAQRDHCAVSDMKEAYNLSFELSMTFLRFAHNFQTLDRLGIDRNSCFWFDDKDAFE